MCFRFMKQKVFIILPAFLIFFELCAQSDFRSGYVITNAVDTVYGLIDYKGNKANAKRCVYKTNAEAEPIEYTPDQLKAYRFKDSKYYISRSINTDEREELLFLEYLIDGIVDVFYYRDAVGEQYLIEDSEGRLMPLKKEQVEVLINNKPYLQVSNRYIGILKSVFRESPEIMKRVDNISLNHRSLIKIANEYHEEVCFDRECIIYEKTLPGVSFTFGPMIGVNYITISANDNVSVDYLEFSNSDFNHYMYPSPGFFMKFSMPNLNERLYFQYEASYHKWSLETDNIYKIWFESKYGSYSQTRNKVISVTQNAFNNSGLIRYEFPKGKIRPVMHAGCFVNWFFKTDYLCQNKTPGGILWSDTTGASLENPLNHTDFGFSIGTGSSFQVFRKHFIFLDIKYQRGLGILRRKNLFTNAFILSLSYSIH